MAAWLTCTPKMVVIQALVEEALQQGNTSPKYHQLTRPRLMEGRRPTG
jgi:hypothetical protein